MRELMLKKMEKVQKETMTEGFDWLGEYDTDMDELNRMSDEDLLELYTEMVRLGG